MNIQNHVEEIKWSGKIFDQSCGNAILRFTKSVQSIEINCKEINEYVLIHIIRNCKKLLNIRLNGVRKSITDKSVVEPSVATKEIDGQQVKSTIPHPLREIVITDCILKDSKILFDGILSIINNNTNSNDCNLSSNNNSITNKDNNCCDSNNNNTNSNKNDNYLVGTLLEVLSISHSNIYNYPLQNIIACSSHLKTLILCEVTRWDFVVTMNSLTSCTHTQLETLSICRPWNNENDDDGRNNPTYILTEDIMIEICISCPNIKYLDISQNGSNLNTGVLSTIAQCLPQLLSFNVSHISNLTDDDMCIITESCHILQSLSLTSTNVSLPFFQSLFTNNCNNITYIDITMCQEITDECMILLCTACTKISTIIALQCNKITNNGWIRVLELCGSTLQHLNLSCNLSLHSTVIDAIAMYCSTLLTTLDLSNCMNITDLSVQAVVQKCVNLSVLNLENVYNVTDNTIILIAQHCKQLQDINIDDTQITDNGILLLVQNCKRLCNISINSCHACTNKSLQHISKYCFNSLKSISISNTSKITNDGVDYILKYCKILSNITLSNNISNDMAHKFIDKDTSSSNNSDDEDGDGDGDNNSSGDTNFSNITNNNSNNNIVNSCDTLLFCFHNCLWSVDDDDGNDDEEDNDDDDNRGASSGILYWTKSSDLPELLG